jgi:hypothetical protein
MKLKPFETFPPGHQDCLFAPDQGERRHAAPPSCQFDINAIPTAQPIRMNRIIGYDERFIHLRLRISLNALKT